MQKIPTLFLRDPDDPKRVTIEPHPACTWVLDGEGVATQKFDGTCVRYDGDRWWARREVKPGKPEPDGWVEVDHDETTGKRVGWEPAERSGFSKFLDEAIGEHDFEPGTYELCGPKINGNPELLPEHALIPHGKLVLDAPRTYLRLADYLERFPGEGIVWHHPDGRMAKLKKRDFR